MENWVRREKLSRSWKIESGAKNWIRGIYKGVWNGNEIARTTWCSRNFEKSPFQDGRDGIWRKKYIRFLFFFNFIESVWFHRFVHAQYFFGFRKFNYISFEWYFHFSVQCIKHWNILIFRKPLFSILFILNSIFFERGEEALTKLFIFWNSIHWITLFNLPLLELRHPAQKKWVSNIFCIFSL